MLDRFSDTIGTSYSFSAGLCRPVLIQLREHSPLLNSSQWEWEQEYKEGIQPMHLYHICKFILLWAFSLDQGVNETLELNDFQRQIHSPPATVSPEIFFRERFGISHLWNSNSVYLGKSPRINYFFKFIFLLKDNCFTEFCCFLSNLNMNQP